MDSQTYTHRDLAGLLKVSETTVKSYRSKFPTFLPVAREGKPVRLHPEALAVCLRIRDLFADGLSIAQTSDRLRAEFKEYPLNRRLSMPRAKAVVGAAALGGAPSLDPGLDSGLDARLDALAKAQQASQDQAQLAAERLERLEAEVRNLATLEAASKSLVAELLSELRAARAPVQPPPPPREPSARPEPARSEPSQPAPQADATVVTARKIVTVHGQAGAVASYALGREPRPEPSFAPPARPAQAFLDLPVVILSDRGEFLGLPGGQSVARLVELLVPEGVGPAVWFEETAAAGPSGSGPEAWICEAPQGPALTRELLFERTTTPRGNLVGVLRRLRTLSGTAATEASTQDLQGFFRQILDQLGS